MEKDITPTYPDGMYSFMTTEHFTLSAARGIINGEISNRINLYFTTLSSVLIAAAFIAQLDTMGSLFSLFGSIALPLLFLMGLFTLGRLITLGNMDMTYVRAINRIRHFYTLAAPPAAAFMLFPPHDDNKSVFTYGGYSIGFRGNLLSAGNTVSIANSLVGTLGIGALASGYFNVPVTQFLPFGVGAYFILYLLHGLVGVAISKLDIRPVYMESRFPNQETEQDTPEG